VTFGWLMTEESWRPGAPVASAAPITTHEPDVKAEQRRRTVLTPDAIGTTTTCAAGLAIAPDEANPATLPYDWMAEKVTPSTLTSRVTVPVSPAPIWNVTASYPSAWTVQASCAAASVAVVNEMPVLTA
jgi:hypothetical protein